MDADYEVFEIVSVFRDFWLVDAESYQRKYYTVDGKPHTPGYYLVNWPEYIKDRRFNHFATFHGPFKTRQEAQATLEEWTKAQETLFHRHNFNRQDSA